jgi:flagellar biosynthetic protein FliR
VVTELIVGLMIGLGAALLVGAAEVAGELLSIQVGLQGSAIVDPLSQQQTTALGQFLQLLAVTLLLSLNAHTVMLQALKASVDLVPVGASAHLREGLGAMMRLGTVLFALGLRFAAPVIAVILIVNIALAVLNRAAPQLQIMSVAFPVQILAGLTALIALVPLLGSWFFGWEMVYDDLLGRVLPVLRPGGVR